MIMKNNEIAKSQKLSKDNK